MKTYKLQDGDIVFEDGAPVMIEGNDAVKQRLEIGLRMDLASWYFNPEKGIPWLDIYNRKAVSERLVRSNIERVLTGDPEVTEVAQLLLDFDRSERKINVTFHVETIYGTVEGSV